MKYRKLTDTGDYKFGGFSQFHQDTPEAVLQAVQTRLALATGEWFLNLREGTDWGGSVLGYGTQGVRDLVLQSRILGTAGVREIVSYDSYVNTAARSFSMNATIDTIYGTTTVEFSSR